MPDPTAGEIGGVFAGIVALLIAIGKGAAWLINLEDRRATTRTAKLDAWQKELQDRERQIDRKQDESHRLVEQQLADLTNWAIEIQLQHSALANALQLVSAALRIIEPENVALSQSDELLKVAFPPNPIVPATLIRLLNRIGEKPDPGRPPATA